MNPKAKIFNILNEVGGVVSGEFISAQIGISRVSVWKHIKAMVQSGITISSSPKGYHLIPDPDRLINFEFGLRQERIHFFRKISSTMDKAITLARQGCPDNTVVVAEQQTHGRGRMKRVWLSAKGGLYFTIVVRPNVDALRASLVNIAAAIDMADSLRSFYQIDASLKWPNDILVGQHKLCGILSQMETEGNQVAYISIGIGLNVNNSPQNKESTAISLEMLQGHPVPRRKILVEFLDRFEKRIIKFDPHSVIEEWKANNMTIGRSVRVVTFKNTYKGTAIDIDPYGGLILQQTDGNLQTVIHGDCFHQ